MTRIAIQGFRGEMPRASTRLLPESAAQEATNCKLWSGELRPWRGLSAVVNPTKAGPLASIYPIVRSGVTFWAHWTQDVNAVRGPIAGDTTSRTYYTGTDAPRITNNVLVDALAGTGYPTDSYILGVPPSAVAPTVALAGVGSGTVASRAYVRTFVSTFGEEGSPSPVSAILAWQPGNTVNMSNLGKAVTSLARSGSTVTANVAAHGFSTNDRILHGGADQDGYSGVHAITLVDANNYTYQITETPVTPATGTISANKVAITTTLGKRKIVKHRFYRIASGVAGAAYLFVAEQAIGLVTYSDAVAAADLGAELETTFWAEPPATLAGMISLPNGVMAGFVDNQCYLAEPFAPYAWLTAYRQTVGFPIVALGNFGSTIVVATSSTPYLINGIDPAYAAPTQHPGILPCVSKRGLVSTEYGVLYPSSSGLVRVTPSGAQVITLPIIDADDWPDFKPSTMHAVFHNEMYIAFYSTGVVDGLTKGRGIIIEGIGKGELHVTQLDFYRYGSYLDPSTNKLYLINYDGTTNTIEEWEGLITRQVYAWKSKVFSTQPTCFQAAKVVASYESVLSAAQVAQYQAIRDAQLAANALLLGNGAGSMNGAYMNLYEVNGDALVEPITVPTAEPSSVEFQLYGDGVLRHAAVVATDKPFRLPGGYLAAETEVRLSGTAPVQRVVIAENLAELRES